MINKDVEKENLILVSFLNVIVMFLFVSYSFEPF